MKQKLFPLLILLASFQLKSTAQIIPAGFVDQTIHNAPNTYIGLTIDNSGRIFVWEKDGLVWLIINGVRSALPILNLSAKTHGQSDLGLICLVLDPNFISNGHIYVSYCLDPSLIPGYSISQPATYGIVSRFTLNNHLSNNPTADINSELILLGQNKKGIPITYVGHFGGALSFGDDGSLMVTAGDGGFFDNADDGNHASTYHSKAISLGIMTSQENIGANRSQLNESISGKMLRIDPLTGAGLPDNPLYNSTDPNATISKVWAKGLRNPWTMLKIPNSGNHHFPGKFLVGDVGSGSDEELNLVHQSNLNFGWPRYEGIDFNHWLRPSQYIPTVWEKPKIAMRDNIYGLINGTKYLVGSTQLPGNNTSGNGSILLGDFNNNVNFPADYQDNLYFGDYAGKNIYRLKFDQNNNPTFVKKFISTGKYLFGIKVSPLDGNIYYLSSSSAYGGSGELHKVSYSPSNNQPIAKIESDVVSGGSKLTVNFHAKFSYDPDNNPLTYSWSFSDGQTASGLSPFVTFSTTSTSVVTITATLTVTDNLGSTSTASKTIQLNNLPPVITLITTSPLVPEFIPSGSSNTASFTAVIEDENISNVTFKWQAYEVHNGHEHLAQTVLGNSSTLTIPTPVCSPPYESYWAKIKLTATDQNGLEATKEMIYSPSCGLQSQTITFPSIFTQTTASNTINLNATSNSGLGISYFVMNGFGSLIGANLQLLGIPGKITVRAAQNGDSSFDQAKFQEITFDYIKARTNQTISFQPIPTQVDPFNPISPDATSSLGKPITYVWISGPATVLGNQIIPFGSPGWVTIRAFNSGDTDTNEAFSDQSFYVCPNELTLNILHKATDEENYRNIRARDTINSTSKVENLTRLIYDAGKQINFLPGFEITSGAVFESKLVGCPN